MKKIFINLIAFFAVLTAFSQKEAEIPAAFNALDYKFKTGIWEVEPNMDIDNRPIFPTLIYKEIYGFCHPWAGDGRIFENDSTCYSYYVYAGDDENHYYKLRNRICLHRVNEVANLGDLLIGMHYGCCGDDNEGILVRTIDGQCICQWTGEFFYEIHIGNDTLFLGLRYPFGALGDYGGTMVLTYSYNKNNSDSIVLQSKVPIHPTTIFGNEVKTSSKSFHASYELNSDLLAIEEHFDNQQSKGRENYTVVDINPNDLKNPKTASTAMVIKILRSDWEETNEKKTLYEIPLSDLQKLPRKISLD
ncbi:MAG: hypothetical protein MJZ49_00980 [Bacteroidales bacterium]|nr:hypothetical protein [Bacteroidales bacterium]